MVKENLSELLRNSPATVHSDTSTGCEVITSSGTKLTFLHSELYELTGKEKLPLPEANPDLRKVPGWLKQRALQATGHPVEKLLSGKCMESPELSACWEELGFRAVLAKDLWPNTRAVLLNAQEIDWALTQWEKAPGSPESAQGLHQLT